MLDLKIECKTFDQLSLNELYQILALRQNVFVIEQNCLFNDIDFKDQYSYHCMAFVNHELVAYTRLFDENKYYKDYLSIGRVVGAASTRGKGYGKIMFKFSIKKAHEIFGNKPIKIGAQAYLEKFYTSFGFKTTNEDYVEDGIPHKILVLHPLKSNSTH